MLIAANMAAEMMTAAETSVASFGNSIATYLINNCEISFAWSAVSAPPASTPDPVVVASGGISSLSISMDLSNADNHTSAMSYFSGIIILGVTAGLYNITDSGFTTTAGGFTTAPTVGGLSIDLTAFGQKDNRQAVFVEIASQIIDYITGLVPTGSCAGTHGIYTGAGTVSGIV